MDYEQLQDGIMIALENGYKLDARQLIERFPKDKLPELRAHLFALIDVIGNNTHIYPNRSPLWHCLLSFESVVKEIPETPALPE